MGASRKLQGEIDRVLKKVQEGVDVFESIWKKVYDTENANQKEKFEGELKKEIKKLQRHRDQIKTWIQSSEIKDKKVSASYEQALVDARKIIEREMEKFKICEKETKMKAFSKEGLGQQPKTDPKEKAKSETREWLNSVVGELESQIDSFEAEIEGLSIKKGKARPPRLAHLETSISRHKAHIMKVELILRLLDNDQLSPEEVNDVKDFLDDYMERNQDDFDEFSDVDELYSSLPLDKLESLEDLVAIPPGIVKSVGAVTATLSSKTSLTAPATLQVATVTSPVKQGTSMLDQVEETASQESVSARTPPPKGSTIFSSGPPTPAGTYVNPGATHASIHNVSSPTTSAIPSAPSPARVVLENIAGAQSTHVPSSGKEDSRKSSSTLPETGLSSVSRGELPNHSSTSIPPTFGTAVPSGGPSGALPSAFEATRRKIPGADELPSGISQPLVSSSNNRTTIPQAVKANDGSNSTDSGNVDSAATAGRVFSSSVVSGMQWRPGSSFQNQNEAGQVRGRTEIAPDQREKFLQRFQQVQQQGQSIMLGMPHLGGGPHKQFSAQQQHPILHQFNSQGSSVSHQVGLGIGSQAPGLVTVSSSSSQHPNSIRQQATQLISTGVTGPKDTEVDPDKVEGIHQLQSSSDDLLNEPAPRSELNKHLIHEDEMKASFAFDAHGGVTNTLTESSQLSRDTDFAPGQPLQSNPLSGGIGVIGRRSVSDLGAIGNNIGSSSANSLEIHDKSYNLQMLEAAYGKLPQPKDSERARNYTAINPAVTFPSYPQVQAPIVNNPAFWQRMGAGDNGPDTLFFAFYYQQNTYQQYLAAKELKKQSWRFHRKYNTWFQRHEEPQVTTDEYEQGTYVYFDYHITNDEMHHGWCQRIKTEFTFEYNYLEDELVV